jgi:MFS family permease
MEVTPLGSQRFGQTLGTMSFISGLASASPALGGWLWDNISPRVLFILTLIFAVAIGFIICFKIEEFAPALGLDRSERMVILFQESRLTLQ